MKYAFVVLTLLLTAVVGQCACLNHSYLDEYDDLTVGIRFNIKGDESRRPEDRIELAFRRALDYWSTIIEMNWTEESSDECVIEVTDQVPYAFDHGEIAYAGSAGTIAIKPGLRLSPRLMYSIAVHELGHEFGLDHNEDQRSFMRARHAKGTEVLLPADLEALAAKHKLRGQAETITY